MRIRQHVEAPASGVESFYDWSTLYTVEDGKVVLIEFLIDRVQALRAAGIS
jgi:hypothetical protein